MIAGTRRYAVASVAAAFIRFITPVFHTNLGPSVANVHSLAFAPSFQELGLGPSSLNHRTTGSMATFQTQAPELGRRASSIIIATSGDFCGGVDGGRLGLGYSTITLKERTVDC